MIRKILPVDMINMKINLLLSDYHEETSHEHKILMRIKNLLESVDCNGLECLNCFGYIVIDHNDEKIIKEESNNILVAINDTYSNFFSSCEIIENSLKLLNDLKLKCCHQDDNLC